MVEGRSTWWCILSCGCCLGRRLYNKQSLHHGARANYYFSTDRARSISPEKAVISTPGNTSTRTLSRTNTNVSLASPSHVTMTPPSSAGPRQTAAHNESLHRLTGSVDPEKTSPKVEDVPDFRGFGTMKRSSAINAPSATTSITSPVQRSSVPNPSPTPSATNLARSGTLSWQQRRPTSRVQPSSRPLSVVATHNSAAQPASFSEPEPSRDQIAASLGVRDPSWFKQTAERGIGSAAYRKSKDEVGMAETVSPGRRELVGLSQEQHSESGRQTSPPVSESIQSDSVSRNSQRESVYSIGSRYSATSSSSSVKPDLRSLIAADEGQRRVSPTFVSEQNSAASGDSGGMARSVTMSSQARLANGSERPLSPTKGMGGFVQSAMMKRSDSQSKRWSTQPTTSVSRHNSVASARSSGLQNSFSMPKLETTDAVKGTTEERASRPTSSSNHANTSPSINDGEVFVKSAISRHSRSKSVASTYSTNDELPQSPGSPSKRFSPNKSSWLESSLTKPESPKPAPAKNSAPSWMADLASRKAQRASADSTPATATSPHVDREESTSVSRPGSPLKGSPFGPSMLKRPESRDFASTTGNTTATQTFRTARPTDKDFAIPLTSSPSHSRRNDTTPDLATAGKASDPEKGELSVVPTESDSVLPEDKTQDIPKVEAQPTPTVERPSTPESKTTRSREKSLMSPPPSLKQVKSETNTPKAANDFRSQLRSRPPPEMKIEGQPEFLSKFGNLRKTQPEKFVAPDVLKDNILRGKSGLAVSSGPVKIERRDELRESLVAKKDDIKKAKDEGQNLPGQTHERKISQVAQEPPPRPEALSRRELLGRSDSSRNAQPAEKIREATPEALATHKSIKHKSTTMPPSDTHSLTEPKMDVLSKQVSAPSSVGSKQSDQTSKLASRFNPGLAGLLARGPPSVTPSRTGSPVTMEPSGSGSDAALEPSAPAGPLQDMRKDRAKGPRRKGGARTCSSKGVAIVAAARSDKSIDAQSQLQSPKHISAPKTSMPAATATLTRSPPLPGSPNFSRPNPSVAMWDKPVQIKPSDDISRPTSQLDGTSDSQSPAAKAEPQALPSSAAAVLAASLKKTSNYEQAKTPVLRSDMPITPSKSPSLISTRSTTPDKASSDPVAVPEFKGFGSMKKQRGSQPPDADKENTDESAASVKETASFWGRRTSPQKEGPPALIQLPTKKDEEAAMRSAGLLASNNGLGITSDKAGDRSAVSPASARLPPKPAKSSRIVSGQLAEASPNKGQW